MAKVLVLAEHDGKNLKEISFELLGMAHKVASGGPVKALLLGEGVSELRIDYGPGYRIYFKKRGRELIILLAGRDKSTQVKDIKTALRLARNLVE